MSGDFWTDHRLGPFIIGLIVPVAIFGLKCLPKENSDLRYCSARLVIALLVLVPGAGMPLMEVSRRIHNEGDLYLDREYAIQLRDWLSISLIGCGVMVIIHTVLWATCAIRRKHCKTDENKFKS